MSTSVPDDALELDEVAASQEYPDADFWPSATPVDGIGDVDQDPDFEPEESEAEANEEGEQ